LAGAHNHAHLWVLIFLLERRRFRGSYLQTGDVSELRVDMGCPVTEALRRLNEAASAASAWNQG